MMSEGPRPSCPARRGRGAGIPGKTGGPPAGTGRPGASAGRRCPRRNGYASGSSIPVRKGAAGTRAASNIQRDPRVVCMNDQYPTYYEIKGVTIHGRAEPVDDPALAARLPSDPIDRDAADRTVYAVPLDDVTSFDFTKIKAKV